MSSFESFRFLSCPAIIGLIVAVSCFFPPPSMAVQAVAQEAAIRAHLQAGEFAPAVALARQVEDRQRRDALLGQVAEMQARVGARDASLRSAAEIYDDRARADTISQIVAEPLGGRGGGNQADFDPLIELIETTISPDSWDTIGGPGAIAPFATGVFVDAEGVLRTLVQRESAGHLAALHSASMARSAGQDVRRPSPLRKVSLPRLEKHIQLLLASGRRPTESMQVLAGLQRIKYVLVYPETGDLVLAGPAGDWQTDKEGRIVSAETKQPILRLDDMVVVLRRMLHGPDTRFGCLIVPRQEALAKVQAFLKESSKKPIPPGAAARRAWVQQLRSQLGRQDIELYGLNPRSRAANVMVEADYHMKLVGMGLADGVPGVKSYLDLVDVPPGEAPPPMSVLRWWFTLNYDAVLATERYNAFEIRGQGVQVLSENELLTAEGKRVHTGKSEALNRQFARSFTEHFSALSQKYPLYAELRNLFDLAMVGALIREGELADQVDWHLTCFGDPKSYSVGLGVTPKEVETVVNHRVVNRIHVLAGVSGGVRVAPAPLVARAAVQIAPYGTLSEQRLAAEAKDLPPGAWWWD